MVRAGWYGKRPHQRQRWLCKPANGDEQHRFTPTLTRQQHTHAAPHGYCLECSTRVHDWEGQAGARTYRFAAREIGDALASVAGGQSYRSAAASARRRADRMPARPWTGSRKRSREAALDGQVVANWVDVFTDPLAERLLPEAWPEILVIDSIGMRVRQGPRGGDGFYVIAAVGRTPIAGQPGPRLDVWRLMASPTKTADAYEQFCRSLPGRPRVVITDMDAAIRRGIGAAFVDANGELPEMRMGEWHLGRSLRKRIPDELRDDHTNPVMQCLGPAFYDPAHWAAFVDAVYVEHAVGKHGPLNGLLAWIKDYGQIIEQQSATRDPQLPHSTSPVEAPLAKVGTRLRGRAGSFSNLARMNNLLALMALDLRGQADGRQWADLIRQATYDTGGHAPAQRQHDDPRGTNTLTG